MKIQRSTLSLLFAGILTTTLLTTTGARAEHHESVPAREDAVLISITAVVEAIDQETREVILKGPLGNTVTFIAGEEVRRLNEFSVGDTVEADYYVSIAAELRSPTEEEKANPLEIIEAEGRASDEHAPAGGAVQVIKAVCTVEGLDRPTMTATLKGPLGRYVTVRVADPERITKVRIGDTVIVTYTQALAISLEKVTD